MDNNPINPNPETPEPTPETPPTPDTNLTPEPTPVEEPTPIEPAPAEEPPILTDPTPAEDPAVEPTPVEEPTPIESAPTESTPVENTPSEPTPETPVEAPADPATPPEKKSKKKLLLIILLILALITAGFLLFCFLRNNDGTSSNNNNDTTNNNDSNNQNNGTSSDLALNIIGRWEFIRIESPDLTLYPGDFFVEEIILEFLADGTASSSAETAFPSELDWLFDLFGDSVPGMEGLGLDEIDLSDFTIDGTWTISGNTLTISSPIQDDVIYTVDITGDILTLTTEDPETGEPISVIYRRLQ